MLDLLPIRVVDRRVDHRSPIQQFVLVAEFVGPKAVGMIRRGNTIQAQLLEGRLAQRASDVELIRPTRAKTSTRARIEQMAIDRAVSECVLGGHAYIGASLVIDFATASVENSIGHPVDRLSDVKPPQSDVHVPSGADRVGEIAEQGFLDRVGQLVAGVGNIGTRAKESAGTHGIDELIEIVSLARIIGADGPLPRRLGLGRCKANLL